MTEDNLWTGKRGAEMWETVARLVAKRQEQRA